MEQYNELKNFSNSLSFNKNDKQMNFNEIKGTVCELNDDPEWASITLNVGHENTRQVNVSCKKEVYNLIKNKYKVGDKVSVRFYVASRFKGGRFYTSCHCLQVDLSNGT